MKINKKQTLLLGGHISIAGGIHNAISHGEKIHCTAIQIFTKNNRQWSGKALTENDVKNFKAAWKKSPYIKSIIAHSTYLINIGSPKKDVYEKSLTSLKDEVKRCNMLGIPYLVLHPGSHLKTSEDACLKQIAKALDVVLSETPGICNILLETMAGQGTGVCYTFEHIAKIFDLVKHKERLGVCFDTCHTFAAGYDFRTKIGYQNVINHFDNIIGLKELKIMHINDSMKKLASRVDRHADIGKGEIGINAFALIFNDERFFNIPKILETPPGTLENYTLNMQVIRKLLSETTKKRLHIYF